jgi:glycosyltransferase involved in cell wall biosynthesis
MQAADCLVCPSLWAEAAGLVILEAMACGLPVVASRIGGIPEFVIDGVTGYLIPPGDHNLLAIRIRALLDDPLSRRMMGLSARTLGTEQYSAQRRLPEFLGLYTGK